MKNYKDIRGFENRYTIDDSGRVYSKRSNKYLIPQLRNGYYKVMLFEKYRYKNMKVHRIVAEHFIPNPENKPCVNHLDGNRINNNVSNLEWCTYSENTRHAFRTGLMDGRFPRPGHYRPIQGVNILTGKIVNFPALMIAAKEMGVGKSTICNNLRGRYKSSAGYRWSYV